jgi:ubiquinone/menaquinone biosynthesis C-methylase UbiE
MLQLAEVTREDVLYDLGCGHGAIVVAAAKKYGIRAVGVDIDPRRIEQARAHAQANHVEERMQFILGDAKKMDLKEATVITIYLGIAANLRLVEQFQRQLRPGSRIVSRDFQIYSWKADRLEKHQLENGAPTYLYLWKIKERDA